MKKSIEEMIRSGCTYEEAADAFEEAWDKAVAEREYVTKEVEARQTLLIDYEKYLKIVYPNITSTDLEKNVAELQTTLIDIRDIFHKCNKIKELQQKSKEQTKEKSEDWIERLLKKIEEAEKRDAETAIKPNLKKVENASLDDFLKKMGW